MNPHTLDIYTQDELSLRDSIELNEWSNETIEDIEMQQLQDQYDFSMLTAIPDEAYKKIMEIDNYLNTGRNRAYKNLEYSYMKIIEILKKSNPENFLSTHKNYP